VTRLDWIAVAIAALGAFAGLRRGLVATALSFAGVAGGAVLGARIGPTFLHGGSSSFYTPAAALAGAVVGGVVLRWLAGMVGSMARGGLALVPPLRLLDTLGGLVAGAALALGVVWVAGALLLQLPYESSLTREARRSAILRQLNTLVPPRTVLRALARVDPFPSLAGPSPPALPPDTRVLRSAAVVRARRSIVRVTGTACGLGVEGSGWVARPHVVVTAAHVVAGANGLAVSGHSAVALVVDRAADVAVLRVPGLRASALPIVDSHPGAEVAILGFPLDGPFDARPGRVGTSARVVVGGVEREVTAVAGLVRHGNSGGPAVDLNGAVETTIFASRLGAPGGYGIPAGPVRAALARARKPVSTGSC